MINYKGYEVDENEFKNDVDRFVNDRHLFSELLTFLKNNDFLGDYITSRHIGNKLKTTAYKQLKEGIVGCTIKIRQLSVKYKEQNNSALRSKLNNLLQKIETQIDEIEEEGEAVYNKLVEKKKEIERDIAVFSELDSLKDRKKVLEKQMISRKVADERKHDLIREKNNANADKELFGDDDDDEEDDEEEPTFYIEDSSDDIPYLVLDLLRYINANEDANILFGSVKIQSQLTSVEENWKAIQNSLITQSTRNFLSVQPKDRMIDDYQRGPVERRIEPIHPDLIDGLPIQTLRDVKDNPKDISLKYPRYDRRDPAIGYIDQRLQMHKKSEHEKESLMNLPWIRNYVSTYIRPVDKIPAELKNKVMQDIKNSKTKTKKPDSDYYLVDYGLSLYTPIAIDYLEVQNGRYYVEIWLLSQHEPKTLDKYAIEYNMSGNKFTQISFLKMQNSYTRNHQSSANSVIYDNAFENIDKFMLKNKRVVHNGNIYFKANRLFEDLFKNGRNKTQNGNVFSATDISGQTYDFEIGHMIKISDDEVDIIIQNEDVFRNELDWLSMKNVKNVEVNKPNIIFDSLSKYGISM